MMSKNITLLVLTFLFSTQTVFAKKMYRWVNEKGNVYYSDQIPPEQVQHRRESLNEDARVVEVLEKQKTKAQFDREKKLARLREQKQQIIAKQAAADKVLLSTFRQLKDIKFALEGKISALDGQRRVVQGTLGRLKGQLNQQQKRAAQYERDGKKVPAKFLKDISATQQQIKQTLAGIARQFEKKKKIKAEFETHINRFIFLTKSEKNRDEQVQKTNKNKFPNELGLYFCHSVTQCDKAWAIAKQFVITYSTTQLEFEIDELIMSQAPAKDTDLSLSVSKITDNNQQQLFLDINCRQSILGRNLCRGEKPQKIRASFSDYIKSNLVSQSQGNRY